jgi:hypothetical protein
MDFPVKILLLRNSCESVACSMPTERACARREYRGFTVRLCSKSLIKIVLKRISAEPGSVVRLSRRKS